MEKYYVIHNGEGDTRVREFTKDELIENINDGFWGMDISFLDKIPENTDTNYWGGQILIIKGTISTPRPKKIIETYTIQ